MGKERKLWHGIRPGKKQGDAAERPWRGKGGGEWDPAGEEGEVYGESSGEQVS